MSSSIDNAANITHAEVGNGAIIEETAAKQLTPQMEHLSIEKNKEEDTTDNVTACANCGKEGDAESMNTCNKCKMVHYCNAACKKKHKSKHKKKCNKLCEVRAAELHEEDLFKESPAQDDCPICFLPMPLNIGQTEFKSCCGKRICGGCIYGMIKEEAKRGKKKEEWGMCALCRTLREDSDEEEVKRIQKLMESGNADAFFIFSVYYGKGSNGMPQDLEKANELLLKAGELGNAEAYSRLGYSYAVGRGTEVDKKKAKHYLELAAINGSVSARCNLGVIEGQAGNEHRALKHDMIAARAGHKESLDIVKEGFTKGFITKDEYASTLRVYHERQSETKSEARDAYAEY